MIRPYEEEDMEDVVRIWLEASLQAHDFIPRGFWENAAADMRSLYLPMSDEIVLHVDDDTGKPDAFLAFVGSFLAALFVAPEAQGRGLGSRMFRIAGRMHPGLSLCVYRENVRAVEFYRRRGLTVLCERVEEKTGHVELVMGMRCDGEEKTERPKMQRAAAGGAPMREQSSAGKKNVQLLSISWNIR